MDLLDYPEAKALLRDAELAPEEVAACVRRLEDFAQRYLPHFYRTEQRHHALTVLRGQLTGLQRKTTEPIAPRAGLKRRPLQLLVGAGQWGDDAVLGELHRHVAETLGGDDAVFVLDGSGFPKKGAASRGVARQWCGRLGKVDNCQVGVFLAYAAKRGKALLDAHLYLPRDWAADRRRRAKTYVPTGQEFQEKWRIGLTPLDAARAVVPGGWVAGDDEFGRWSELRSQWRRRRLRYVPDVPCNTPVRDVAERRPASRPGGRARLPLFGRVDRWVARQPAGRWRAVTARDGEKGPLAAKVLLATVQTEDEDGRVGPSEKVVVIRTCEREPRPWYALPNARQAKRGELTRVRGSRHRVEELLGEGNQGVGLSHYEVRSRAGWHHPMTLSLLALWFLQAERQRLGEKNAGGDGAAGASNLHGVAARPGGGAGADRVRGQPGAAA